MLADDCAILADYNAIGIGLEVIANEDMDQFVVTVGPTARQGPQPTFGSPRQPI